MQEPSCLTEAQLYPTCAPAVMPTVGMAPTLGISAEAAAFLSASGAKLLQMKAVSLVFPQGVQCLIWSPGSRNAVLRIFDCYSGVYLQTTESRRW